MLRNSTYEPTVIFGCTHDMRIMREEIFGPVLPISTFKTLDEAFEKANDCVFGLTSSIYTQDYETVMCVRDERDHIALESHGLQPMSISSLPSLCCA